MSDDTANHYGAAFARSVKEARAATGMSQESMVEKLRQHGVDIHVTAIGKIEKGMRKVSIDEAVAFSRVLGVPIADLVGFDDSLSTAYRNLANAHEERMRWEERVADALVDIARAADSSQVALSEVDEWWLDGGPLDYVPGAVVLGIATYVEARVERDAIDVEGTRVAALLRLLRSDAESVRDGRAADGDD